MRETQTDFKKRLDSIYKDLDLSLPIHPLTKNIKPVTGVSAVNKSIKHLVFSAKWDYPFQPDIYGGISQMLFEQPIPVHFSHVQNVILQVLKKNEPRIKVTNVTVDWLDEQSMAINIEYLIVAIDKSESTRIILKRER